MRSKVRATYTGSAGQCAVWMAPQRTLLVHKSSRAEPEQLPAEPIQRYGGTTCSNHNSSQNVRKPVDQG